MQQDYYKQFQTWYTKFQVSKSPQMNLVWGFFLYVLFGCVLLCIPVFHKTDISLIDSLFMSTSAVSTTGLATISTYDSYNFAGQLIIFSLFQIGGIGYMTLTTYYLLFTTNKITHWHKKLMDAEFTLPETIKIKDFIKSVVVFTLIMEILGAVAFYFVFSDSNLAGWEQIWFSVFHSVSAFCTAGFGLLNDSFISYQDSPYVNTIISILAISGSLGFIVITDIWYRITKKSNKLSFTTKIVGFGFLILLCLGTIVIYVSEPLAGNDTPHAWLRSFFQAMTAMTTVGFNTIPTEKLSLPILLFVTFLMYVGASPSGTAGGMKITTLTAMISVLKSRLLGQRKITFLNRVIPFERLYVATSTFMLYTSLIFLFSFILSYTETASFDQILFEVSSALGTVGLSVGLTGNLTLFGKIMFILLMFIGRVGVLTFGFALLQRAQSPPEALSKGDLAV